MTGTDAVGADDAADAVAGHTYTWYAVTPVSSAEGDQLTAMRPVVASGTADTVTGAVGGVVSGAGAVTGADQVGSEVPDHSPHLSA